MTSPWASGDMKEALSSLPELLELASEALTEDELREANYVAEMLVGSPKQRGWARAKLKVVIGIFPTRPLLYLWPLIDGLPKFTTRDCIRYLGDYIDLLTKEMTYEFAKGRARQSSLGRNVHTLSKTKTVPPELVNKLQKYSDFIYTPGKHDFSLPPGRHHRFTSKEVVLTTYVTAKLAGQIKVLSNLARIAVEKDNLYMIGGRWGSSKRVEYDNPADWK